MRPEDNLMIHAAIALAKPGDILVIDGKGDQTAALMGTLMLSACKKTGLGGVIVDGAIRDKPSCWSFWLSGVQRRLQSCRSDRSCPVASTTPSPVAVRR